MKIKAKDLEGFEDAKDVYEEEDNEPLEREVLPYFKDPKLKISIWTVIKDSIGKDISKMTVPVYFNEPTNLLQRCANALEYHEMLDIAMAQQDSLRRLAYVAAFSVTMVTSIEKSTTKPFNPLLHETYELVTPKMKFLAE